MNEDRPNSNGSLNKISDDVFDLDKPYEDQDRFGFVSAKNSFADIIRRINPPITIGLYGPWGSGKSWMIQGIRQKLESEEYLVLVFDAWKYRHETNLILPLMYRLSREYAKDNEPVKKSIKKIGAAVALSAMDAGLKLATAGLTDIQGVVKTLEIAESGASDLDKYIDKIESLEIDYKKIVEDLLASHKKKKLVVFVDNLDRCLPDIVVELLEDISSFFTVADLPCLYVLAVDRENVIKAIKHRYPDFHAEHYLEKIINLPLLMPEPTLGLDFFIEKYQERSGALIGVMKQELTERLQKRMPVMFSLGLMGNPRRIVRLVNRLVALSCLGKTDLTHDGCIFAELFIFLLLLKEHNPAIYDSLKYDLVIDFLIQMGPWAGKGDLTPEKVLPQIKDGRMAYNNTLINRMVLEYGKGEIFFDIFRFSINVFIEAGQSKDGQSGQERTASFTQKFKKAREWIELIG